MKFGIMGLGGIAGVMSKTVSGMPTVNRYCVASRSLDKAKEFADKWGFEKAYGSYEEMLLDEEVELIYVATPHSHHYECAKQCILHRKNVLLEKPFTVNADQAKELIRLAREHKVFITEAIWTRFMPSRKMLMDIIESGEIGEVTSITANLGYSIAHIERMKKKEYAGGALLDLGVYTIHLAMMVFGREIEKISSDVILTEEGVDAMNSITMYFPGGKMAVLHSTMMGRSNREGMVVGVDGYIEIQNINNCEELRVYNRDGVLQRKIAVPKQITGYEYEVEASMRDIRKGLIECPEIPHEETIQIMEIMDGLRKEWGMIYPDEIEKL